MVYYLLRFLILRTSLLPIALCVRFVVLRDAKTRRVWQQERVNVNTTAEAAALRTMQEESPDWQVNIRAGVYHRTFTSQKLEITIFSVCA